jgi:OmpA-OmpF porin, OOP family
MKSNRVRIITGLMAFCLLTLTMAFAASGDKVKSKGVVTNRVGDTLTVKTADGVYTVLMTDDSKVQRPVGLTGIRKKQMPNDVVIPGLKMSFEGSTDDKGAVVAKEITFDNDDLAMAEVIQAGLNPVAIQQAINMQKIAANKKGIAANKAAIASTQAAVDANAARIAANKQALNQVAADTKKRFSELGQYAEQALAVVYFETGKSVISDSDQEALAALAQDATSLNGYVISVKGFTDSVGDLANNQVLSKERAQSVVAYLLQNCSVPAARIAAPGAMSETNPVASNETDLGRAENRRVEVRVLVNKGISGM